MNDGKTYEVYITYKGERITVTLPPNISDYVYDITNNLSKIGIELSILNNTLIELKKDKTVNIRYWL